MEQYIKLDRHRTTCQYPSTDNILDVSLRGNIIADFLKARSIPKEYVIHIICKGSSGLMLATIVADQLKDDYSIEISFCIVNQHSIIHPITCKKFLPYNKVVHIIMDDFISSGETMIMIKNYIKKTYKDGIIINYLFICNEYNPTYYLDSQDFEDDEFKLEKLVNIY